MNEGVFVDKHNYLKRQEGKRIMPKKLATLNYIIVFAFITEHRINRSSEKQEGLSALLLTYAFIISKYDIQDKYHQDDYTLMCSNTGMKLLMVNK